MMNDERSSLLVEPQRKAGRGREAPQLTGLFERPASTAQIRPETPSLSVIQLQDENSRSKASRPECMTKACPWKYISSTIVGSAVFLLYHIVFCLAQASTITRPNSQHSSTGMMAQLAGLGIFVAGPVFLWDLSDKIPAIYPASDLFLAPFLAELSSRVDAALLEDGQQDDDTVFMATFSVLLLFGFLLSGSLCVLAARVKLANLGSFLPYSVLCGFFSTIGILMWTLGISVDTGYKIGTIMREPSLWMMFLIHHTPSLLVGLTMHTLGKRHPFLVIILVLGTVAGVYAVMFLTGTSLKEAQDQGWFFSTEDFVQMKDENTPTFAPPAPFGAWGSLWRNDVNWRAFFAGLPPMVSLAFLYLIRSSLHSTALKKNIPNLTREKSPESLSPSIRSSARQRPSTKKQPVELGFVLERGYGYSQLASALVGGITVAPSVAASVTLFELGAEHAAPQYGSCLLILIFYCTNFVYVQYIPKPAFSCLMVLAGLDMCRTWMIGSYIKTKSKTEWFVAPVLVALAFLVGLLNAIFIGVGISTFIFVANFYRAGLVRYVGNGLALRSTIERDLDQAKWLDQNGDMIQILVLQNYIFFGNAVSALKYIGTMFEDDNADEGTFVPPVPKYLVIDFTLVSGMDTSAIDVLSEVVALCKLNRCRLYMAGVRSDLKSMLKFAGLEPGGGNRQSRRLWSYTHDLESALGKAENGLLSTVLRIEEIAEKETKVRSRQRSDTLEEDGFVYALKQIDAQHGLNSVSELSGLRSLTHPIELSPGEVLIRNGDGDSGLYFFETGMMRVVPAQSYASVTASGVQGGPEYDPQPSIGHLNARSATIGRHASCWKENHASHEEQAFRLARIGKGWVIGTIESSSGGMLKGGHHIAMTQCRLHHLPRSSMLKVENTDPRIMMKLYKVVSALSCKRQEATIDQLSRFVHILNSPVPRLRGGGKTALGKLQSVPISA